MPVALGRAALAASLVGTLFLPARTPGTLDLSPDPGFAIPESVLVHLSMVGDMARGRDGSLYLADYGLPAILHLEPDGSLRRIIGRRGAGPGEFHSIALLGVHQDSVWALDPAQVRLTLVPQEGRGVATIPFGLAQRVAGATSRPRAGAGIPLGLLPDGGLYLEETMRPGGPPADRTLVLRTARDFGVLDTVVAYTREHQSMRFDLRDGVANFQQPFADHPLIAVSSNGRWVAVVRRPAATAGRAARYSVTLLREGETEQFRREVPYRPRVLAERAVDSIVRMLADPEATGIHSPEVTADSLRRRLYRPAFLPPVEQVAVGQDGTVWLSEVAAGGRPDRAEWVGLAPTGREVARFTTARTFRLLEAEGGALWGVEGVFGEIPSVVRYRPPS